jgi:hypothetical protein
MGDDLASALANYRPQALPSTCSSDFDNKKVVSKAHREKWFLIERGRSLFETACLVRQVEYILMDVEDETIEINKTADIFSGYNEGLIIRALLLGADAISFVDNSGTQNALVLDSKAFRQLLKPRSKDIFEPIYLAGKSMFFHSYGNTLSVLEYFKEVGVGAIWPQLNLYDPGDLAKRCRDLGIAVQLQPGPGKLQQI